MPKARELVAQLILLDGRFAHLPRAVGACDAAAGDPIEGLLFQLTPSTLPVAAVPGAGAGGTVLVELAHRLSLALPGGRTSGPSGSPAAGLRTR